MPKSFLWSATHLNNQLYFAQYRPTVHHHSALSTAASAAEKHAPAPTSTQSTDIPLVESELVSITTVDGILNKSIPQRCGLFARRDRLNAN